MTEAQEEEDRRRSLDFVDNVIPNTRAQLRVLAQSYQVCAGADLTLSLPRVINIKFPLQPHQKYNITQYGELGFP